MRRDYPRFVSLLMASVALVLLLLSVFGFFRESWVEVPVGSHHIVSCGSRNGCVQVIWITYSEDIRPAVPYLNSSTLPKFSWQEQLQAALIGFRYFDDSRLGILRFRGFSLPLWGLWGAAGGIAWVAWRRSGKKLGPGFDVETKKL